MEQKSIQANSGFTLIELSVVITIIALIIGGILLGQSLIRSSQLQSVVTEQVQYTQAISAFRDKYLALPGDFGSGVLTATSGGKGAVDLWGAAATTIANCNTTAATTSTATCNGNANGIIDVISASAINTISAYEQFRAWEHLRNAGFVAVNVNGLINPTAGVATYSKTPGRNLPASRLSGAGWGITFLADATTDALKNTNEPPYGHVLWFGGISTSSTTNLTGAVLTPEEALGLDQKIDDGLSSSGRLIAANNSTCLTTAVNTTSAYDISKKPPGCSLVFKTGY